jgi:hypothetical protein
LLIRDRRGFSWKAVYSSRGSPDVSERRTPTTVIGAAWFGRERASGFAEHDGDEPAGPFLWGLLLARTHPRGISDSENSFANVKYFEVAIH